MAPAAGVTKPERGAPYVRIEELDLEASVGDSFRLSDQLIQALLHHAAVAGRVDGGREQSPAFGRRLTLEKRTWLSRRDGPITR